MQRMRCMRSWDAHDAQWHVPPCYNTIAHTRGHPRSHVWFWTCDNMTQDNLMTVWMRSRTSADAAHSRIPEDQKWALEWRGPSRPRAPPPPSKHPACARPPSPSIITTIIIILLIITIMIIIIIIISLLSLSLWTIMTPARSPPGWGPPRGPGSWRPRCAAPRPRSRGARRAPSNKSNDSNTSRW